MASVSPPLRVIVIGCGRIGTHTPEKLRSDLPKGWLPLSHAEAILATDNLQLVGFCDIDEERCSAAARRFGIRSYSVDYKAFIQELKPDVVSIATRTDVRSEIVLFALEQGVLGIHAEKPLCRNLAQAKAIQRKVKATNARLSYGTTRRYMQIYRQAKEMISEGEIGEVVEIAIDHGRGLLFWSHPHAADLLLFFNPKSHIEFVQSTCLIEPGTIEGDIIDIDPLVENAFVKFSNGVNGIISSAGGMNTRISGTKGNITIGADGSWIRLFKPKTQSSAYFLDELPIESNSTISGTRQAFADLSSALLHSTSLGISVEEIVLSQQMLFAMVMSSLEGGRRVWIDEVNESLTVTGRCGEFYA